MARLLRTDPVVARIRIILARSVGCAASRSLVRRGPFDRGRRFGVARALWLASLPGAIRTRKPLLDFQPGRLPTGLVRLGFLRWGRPNNVGGTRKDSWILRNTFGLVGPYLPRAKMVQMQAGFEFWRLSMAEARDVIYAASVTQPLSSRATQRQSMDAMQAALTYRRHVRK